MAETAPPRLSGSLFGRRYGVLGLVAFSLLGLLAVAATGYVMIQNRAQDAVIYNAERMSISWARYLSGQVEDIESLLTGAPITDAQHAQIERLKSFSDVFRFKLFDAGGHLLIISDTAGLTVDSSELRAHNPKAFSVMSTGEPYTAVEDGTAKPDRPDVYAESYVPIIRNGKVIGIAEAYIDQTEASANLLEGYLEFQTAFALMMLTIIAIPATVLFLMLAQLRRKNGELEAARDKALIAEKAKTEFLATMSHEIRTPMNGVIGTSELMAGTQLDSRQRMFIDIIQSSSRALLEIINDILDFSKIDAGELTLLPRPFKLSRLAIEPAHLLTSAAAAKGIEIVTRTAPDAPRQIIGDFDRLRQVITNLVGNAVKFTDSGDVVIDISVVGHDATRLHDQAAAEDEVTIRVEVRDTGYGIPPEDLDRIFERFSQVDSSSTRTHQGTGLGLAISRGLIEQMGGQIGVTSKVGGGSTFWFTVPLRRDADATSQRKPLPVEVRGCRILVIDDNNTNRLIFDELLSSWGFDAVLVSSGHEGLQKAIGAAAQGRPFDLVLLDHHMPGMDGEDVLRALRQTEECATVPVIILTSILEHNSLARCREDLGLNGCMVKPTASSALLDQIMDTLSADAQALADPDGRPEPVIASASDTAEPAQSAAGNPDVLIVEDNAVNRTLVTHILQNMGLSHISAEDGGEAITTYETTRPRMIIMDVSMPVMNGYDATAAIRSLEERTNSPRIPIIGTTAHAMPGDKQRCIDAGMDDYLSKPLSVDDLTKMVSKWLEEPGATREASAAE